MDRAYTNRQFSWLAASLVLGALLCFLSPHRALAQVMVATPAPVVAAPAPAGHGPCAWLTGCGKKHCNQPTPPRPTKPGVAVSPRQIVAPVGSEVVLCAAVCAKDGFLIAGEPVEWMIAQGGVGEFVALGERDGLFGFPTKVDNQFLRGQTSRNTVRLTRGTPDPSDDVQVLRGQSWVSVTSPVEGTSYITAFAPDVKEWDQRRDMAQIFWVDAQWQFPPPAVNPVGQPHTFTTLVSRYSDQAPVEGWVVRYEITGGPPAGLGPQRLPMVEVPTDSLGQASVEIAQLQPGNGTNSVMVQLIRPADPLRGYTKRISIGTGMTSKTWSAPQMTVKKTGPAQASVGAAITYRVEVTNPGDIDARNVVVRDQVPDRTSFISALPEPTRTGNQMVWNLGTLGARQTRVIEINIRADGPGTITNCAIVSADENLTAQDCVATTVTNAALRVTVRGPETARVGDDVTYEMAVTNAGDGQATTVVIRNDYPAGLQHVSLTSPIERDLGNLNPGQTQVVKVTFRVLQEGQLCQQVAVTADGGVRATGQICTNVTGAPPPPPQPRGQVSMRVTGPATAMMGDEIKFLMSIRNTGTAAIRSAQVIASYEPDILSPTNASGGFTIQGDSLVWPVADLAPGREISFEVVCRCAQAVRQACLRGSVRVGEVEAANGEACVEVRNAPVAPRLGLTVAALDNPLAVGRTTTFVITIFNEGPQTARNVRLEVALPSELTFAGVGQRNPSNQTEAAGVVRFETLTEIPARATRRYEVQVKAARQGVPAVTATVSQTGQRDVVQVRESIEVSR